MKQSRSRNLATLVWLLAVAANAPGQSKGSLAPGAPGKDAKWANAGKQGVGTSNTLQSKVWTDPRFGEGTGSARPLAWSMAQFIRLAVNLNAGKKLETPEIVAKRYLR